MRQKQPYVHEDISVLAKSLKKQIENSEQPPGHVELLNMLAKATGFQNYSSWKNQAHSLFKPSIKDGSQPSVNAVFCVMLDFPAKEIFERDSSGDILDRRHVAVSRVFALIDVIIRIPDSPDGVIRFRASLDVDLLDPELDTETWFKTFLPSAIADLVHTAPDEVSLFDSVDVSLDRYVAEKKTSKFDDRKIDVPVRIDEEHYERLRNECIQAEKASSEFLRVKDILWDTLGDSFSLESAQARKSEFIALSEYLEEYIEASGDMFMYSWNQEKLGGLASLLKTAATTPEKVDKNDWKWARRDIFSATPPTHWNQLVFPLSSIVNKK